MIKKKEKIIQENINRYHLRGWGEGYFTINEKGHLCVRPEPEKGDSGPRIDMVEVIRDIKGEGISFPTVVRFHDILRDKVEELNEVFLKVILESGYQGSFQGVYPIKVNQMREVVEEVLESGRKFHLGLEAGSKSELLAVLAMNEDPESLTILNGYKDYECIKLAMIGRKLKRKIIIIIEKYEELLTTIELSKKMNVRPIIGFRMRPTLEGSGKWKESSGVCAKFGLTAGEIIGGLKLLKEAGLQDTIKLVHFHIGSQVTDIKSIKIALVEAVRFYVGLYKMGVSLEYLDVGGGLGVDYDGSCSTAPSSKNYNLQSYASDIIYTVKQICDREEVPHPTIVTESGRFISAHHSCIIAKVWGEVKDESEDFFSHKEDQCHHLIKNMQEIFDEINDDNLQESYNDILFVKGEIVDAFLLGVLSLQDKAIADQIFQKTLMEIKNRLSGDDTQEYDQLLQFSASRYICNFSIFQSLADVWAINQIIPIVPISRLDEVPTKDCTLVDITCDSDGKINNFVTDGEIQDTIKLHELNDDEYYLGFFLTGAYQDTMGDMHNLFGRINEVHIYLDDGDPSNFYIEEVIRGPLLKEF